MKRMPLPVQIAVLLSALVSGLGGQAAAHNWLGLAPDNILGAIAGFVATIVATAYAHDDGFDTGYQAGKRDGAPGLFDRLDRHS